MFVWAALKWPVRRKQMLFRQYTWMNNKDYLASKSKLPKINGRGGRAEIACTCLWKSRPLTDPDLHMLNYFSLLSMIQTAANTASLKRSAQMISPPPSHPCTAATVILEGSKFELDIRRDVSNMLQWEISWFMWLVIHAKLVVLHISI